MLIFLYDPKENTSMKMVTEKKPGKICETIKDNNTSFYLVRPSLLILQNE